MRIVLSALTFDPAGVVPLDVSPDGFYGDTTRRVNRVATLDGGAAFNDFGYSEADRTLTARWVPRKAATEAAVERLMQLYTRVYVATPRGLYLAVLQTFTPGASESTLTSLVVSKLA